MAKLQVDDEVIAKSDKTNDDSLEVHQPSLPNVNKNQTMPTTISTIEATNTTPSLSIVNKGNRLVALPAELRLRIYEALDEEDPWVFSSGVYPALNDLRALHCAFPHLKDEIYPFLVSRLRVRWPHLHGLPGSGLKAEDLAYVKYMIIPVRCRCFYGPFKFGYETCTEAVSDDSYALLDKKRCLANYWAKWASGFGRCIDMAPRLKMVMLASGHVCHCRPCQTNAPTEDVLSTLLRARNLDRIVLRGGLKREKWRDVLGRLRGWKEVDCRDSPGSLWYDRDSKRFISSSMEWVRVGRTGARVDGE